MTRRYFRALPSDYGAALAIVNAALSLPNNGQESAFAPSNEAPVDSSGRCYLALWSVFCDDPAIAAVFSRLLADGLIEEIDEDGYRSAMADAASG